jgi:hypothetical protein
MEGYESDLQLLMYPFLIKLWNYVVELPVFSVIKPGVADFLPFSKLGTNGYFKGRLSNGNKDD